MIPILTTKELADFAVNKEFHLWTVKTTILSSNNPIILSIIRKYTKHNFTIEKDANGKPFVSSSPASRLFISIAHTNDILLLGISLNPLGVDAEFIRPRSQWQRLAHRYFHEPINSLNDFYHAWTAREACIKLHGTTLFSALKNITISTSKNGIFIKYNTIKSALQFHTIDHYLIACCYPADCLATVKYFYGETV